MRNALMRYGGAMSNIINFCDYRGNVHSSPVDRENLNDFSTIAPLIRDVCLSAGITGSKADEVMSEYKLYFKQLMALESSNDSNAQLNHACHIILGLLIKNKLRP